MSIRKIVDLPFIGPDDSFVDDSLLEISEPKSLDNLGQFESHAIKCDDFKVFALREISNKNTFPDGIHISSFTDIVDTLSVNARPYSPHSIRIPYSKNFDQYVEISAGKSSRDTFKVSSPSMIELSSANTRLYTGNSGHIKLYATATKVAGEVFKTGNAENIALCSNMNVTTNIAPQIIEGPYDIIETGPSAQINVDTLTTAFKNAVDERFSPDVLGRLAYYNHKIVSDIPTGRNIESNCFYCVTTNKTNY